MDEIKKEESLDNGSKNQAEKIINLIETKKVKFFKNQFGEGYAAPLGDGRKILKSSLIPWARFNSYAECIMIGMKRMAASPM